MQSYPGRLDMVSSGDAGFRVKVYLDDASIDIVSHEGEQWSWPVTDMSVQRAGSDRFHLALGDEQVYFTPDEPLSFATASSVHLDEESGRRGWLRRRIEAARETTTAEPAVGEVEFVEDLEPRTTQKRRSRRQHEHEWDEGTSQGVLRRRCVTCGHVSIDITGFVSEFDLSAEPAEPETVTPRPSFAKAG